MSANDAKVQLVKGVNTPIPNAPPDTVTVIDLNGGQPRIVAEIPVPNSIVGPPQNVAISPDGTIAIVTSSTRLDPADATKTVPDDRVTMIDLKASPPVVLSTLHAGNGASGVAINSAGTMALVANRNEGTVSVFTIAGKTLTAAGKVEVGTPESLLSGVVFTRDGRRALVTRNNDSLIAVLTIDGTTVTNTKRDIAANVKPYGIDITPAGDAAIVASIGVGATGGADTLSVIDLTVDPPRTVNHVSVGPVAEGLAVSPRRPVRRRDGHERLERREDVAVLSQQRMAARVLAQQGRAVARRRSADRPLVPGRRLEQRQHDGPRPVRRRTRDHDVPVRWPPAGSGTGDQGEWRAIGDSDGGEIAARSWLLALAKASRETRAAYNRDHT